MLTEPVSIRAENITKRFKSTEALSQISVNLTSGQMHGIIGPEGAGKTTLLRVLLGLLKPQSGRVTYFLGNQEIEFEALRETIAYMPQQQSLYPDLSIEEHLDFFRELYSIPKADYLKKRDELLQITRLGPFLDRSASKLSGGMYKKLGLMCALLRSPSAVLLDEPTNGVDPISRREFWDLLYQLADQNILVVITTSYMDEAERCGHVHLLEEGKLVTQGNPHDLLKEANAKSFDELFLQRGRT